MDSEEERARARDVLDAQEESGPIELLDDDGVLELLRRARRIAIVGASSNPARPSFGVIRYLIDHGYDCVPVNPNVDEVQGRPAYATLEEATAATGRFDIVDVFRRSDATPPIARSAVAVGAEAIWFQLGVVNWEAAQIARQGGLAVIMDRCIAIEHRHIR
jgi:uncharacterized protein